LDYFPESEKYVKQYSNSMPITSIKFDMTITLLKDKSPVCKKKVSMPEKESIQAIDFCLDTEARIFGATVPEVFIDFKQHLQHVKLAEESLNSSQLPLMDCNFILEIELRSLGRLVLENRFWSRK
jgi:hypothetical protein